MLMIRRYWKPFLVGLLGWASTSTIILVALLGMDAIQVGRPDYAIYLGVVILALAPLFILSVVKTWKAFWIGMLVGVLTSPLPFAVFYIAIWDFSF